MKRFSKIPRGEAGVSYVELLVVIVVIAVVASLAIFGRGNANAQFQRQNAARELKVAFERARFDSVKRRATLDPENRAYVVVTADGFTVRADNDQNGVLNASDDVSTSTPLGITISSPGTIYFNRRGETVDIGGNLILGSVFMVCNGTCPAQVADSDPSSANLVVVTPTGTVNLLPGGSVPPTFNAPNVQVIPPGTGIRSETHIAP